MPSFDALPALAQLFCALFLMLMLSSSLLAPFAAVESFKLRGRTPRAYTFSRSLYLRDSITFSVTSLITSGVAVLLIGYIIAG